MLLANGKNVYLDLIHYYIVNNVSPKPVGLTNYYQMVNVPNKINDQAT